MLKKQAYINLALVISLLFAMLFQSVHSVEHLAEQLTTEKCHHEPFAGKAQITHSHQHLDHCPICDFTFSSFVAASEYSFRFISGYDPADLNHYWVLSAETQSPSTLFLRGPPSFIV